MTPGLSATRATGGNSMLRALRSRNYRLYYSGQSISLIGTWMQRIAINWLVYRLTGSALVLGVVGFTGQIPTFLLAPFAGVLTDRWNPQRILLVTQILALIQGLTLAILVLTDYVAIWQIVLLSVFLGCVNAFDMPARQSFVVFMVENREDLPNAIALNSTLVNGARLLGPTIAGVLVAAVGEGICFLINGLSYVAVVGALVAMRTRKRNPVSRVAPMLQGLKEGVSYAFGFAPIRSVLLMLSLISIMGMPYSVLMPVFVTDILHGDSITLGFLMASSGAGALLGALYMATRKSVVGLSRVIVVASSTFGVGLAAFSLSRVMWLALLFLAVSGWGMMVQMTASNTILQTIVDEDKRGRVMSFYAMSFIGMAPFGSLLAGALASRLGVPMTLLFGGAACVVGSLVFARGLPSMHEIIRPIYVRKGILPEAP